jgi:hypothetical protein
MRRNAVLARILGFFTLTLFLITGCKQNPGNWPVEKVTPVVAESLKLSDLVLTKTSSGMEGKGKTADGETFTVIVKQDPAQSKISWDAKGDRGSFEEGSFSLQ